MHHVCNGSITMSFLRLPAIVSLLYGLYICICAEATKLTTTTTAIQKLNIKEKKIHEKQKDCKVKTGRFIYIVLLHCTYVCNL